MLYLFTQVYQLAHISLKRKEHLKFPFIWVSKGNFNYGHRAYYVALPKALSLFLIEKGSLSVLESCTIR